MNSDVIQIVIGTLQGIGASTVFVLLLFIGFCVLFGFTKTMKTAATTKITVLCPVESALSTRAR